MAEKAFLSSTYMDLREHRAYAIAALRKAGIQVDPMEDWTAASDPPKVFSTERLRGCDLCVLLVAWRRGHIPDDSSKSITELEYEYARQHGIDVLVFMLDEGAAWPRHFDELDTDVAMRPWREELCEQHGVSFFSAAPETIEISAAIARWLKERSERQRASTQYEQPISQSGFNDEELLDIGRQAARYGVKLGPLRFLGYRSQRQSSVVAVYEDPVSRYVIKRTDASRCDEETLQSLIDQNIKAHEMNLTVTVVTPLAVWMTDVHLWELHPYIDGINAYQLTLRNKYGLRGAFLGQFFNGMVSALALLHQVGLVHRDVRPQNIMIGLHGSVNLVDSTFCSQLNASQIPVVNPSFSPPEQENGNAVIASDWYALAATTLFLANGYPHRRYGEEGFRKALHNVQVGSMYDSPIALLEALLSADPELRPTELHELLLNEHTDAPFDGDILGVLDLGLDRYLVLERSTYHFVSGRELKTKFVQLRDRNFYVQSPLGYREQPLNEQIIEDINAHLEGRNPWLRGGLKNSIR